MMMMMMMSMQSTITKKNYKFVSMIMQSNSSLYYLRLYHYDSDNAL